MFFWRDISIRTKIVTAFATTLFVLIGLGALALAQMALFNASADEMREHWLPSADKIAAIEDALQDFRIKESKLMVIYLARPQEAAPRRRCVQTLRRFGRRHL